MTITENNRTEIVDPATGATFRTVDHGHFQVAGMQRDGVYADVFSSLSGPHASISVHSVSDVEITQDEVVVTITMVARDGQRVLIQLFR